MSPFLPVAGGSSLARTTAATGRKNFLWTGLAPNNGVARIAGGYTFAHDLSAELSAGAVVRACEPCVRRQRLDSNPFPA